MDQKTYWSDIGHIVTKQTLEILLQYEGAFQCQTSTVCLRSSLPGKSPPAKNRQTDREMDWEGHLNKMTDFLRHIFPTM